MVDKIYCNCGDHLYDHLEICPFCNGIKIGNSDLLNYLLGKYNIEYDNLKEEYINNNKSSKPE